MYSIQEVLLTPTFGGNRTKLAKYLGINRATLSRAIKDVNCEVNCILLIDGKYSFRTETVPRVRFVGCEFR